MRRDIDKLRVGRRRRWNNEFGAELVEFAFVLPLLLMLIFGIFWFSRAYNVYETITRAAREGARVGAVPSCATCGNAFPTSATIQTAVNNIMTAENVNPAGAGVSVNIQQHQALGLDPLNPAAQWTVITIGYPYKFTLPFISFTYTTTSPCTASGICIVSKVQMLEEL